MKFFLSIVLLCLSFHVNAQIWPELGFKFGYGPTHMFSTQLYDNPDHNQLLDFKGNFGLRLGLNLGYTLGLTYELVGYQFQQTYEHTYNTADNRPAGINEQVSNFEGLRHLGLLRFRGSKGYGEFGFGVMRVSKQTTEFETNIGFDITSNGKFLKQSLPVFQAGFGAFFIGTDYFNLNYGVNILVGLGNMQSDLGESLNYPVFSPAVEDVSITPLSVEFMAELSFDFAWIYKHIDAKRKVSCRKKKKSIEL